MVEFNENLRKLVLWFGYTAIVGVALGVVVGYYWRLPYTALSGGRYLLTTRGLALYAVLFTAMGFGVATFYLRHPYLLLKRFYYNTLLRRPCIVEGIITKQGNLRFDVVPKAPAHLETNGGYINAPGGIGLMDVGRGLIYYEGCSIPLDLSPQSLDRLFQENSGTNGVSMGSVTPRYVALSSSYIRQFYDAFYNLAVKLGEARVKKKNELILYSLIGLVVLSVVINIVNYSYAAQLSRGMQAVLTKMQQTGYGIK